MAHVSIGSYVDIGQDVKFVCASHEIGGMEPRAGKQIYLDITVEDYCWIGTGSIILPGVTIKQGCINGASAVVTKDTEPNYVYVGCPAHRICKIEN